MNFLRIIVVFEVLTRVTTYLLKIRNLFSFTNDYMNPFSKNPVYTAQYHAITQYMLTSPHWKNNFFLSKVNTFYFFPKIHHFPPRSFPFSHFFTSRSFHLCCHHQLYFFSVFPLVLNTINLTLTSSGSSVYPDIYILPFTN